MSPRQKWPKSLLGAERHAQEAFLHIRVNNRFVGRPDRHGHSFFTARVQNFILSRDPLRKPLFHVNALRQEMIHDTPHALRQDTSGLAAIRPVPRLCA